MSKASITVHELGRSLLTFAVMLGVCTSGSAQSISGYPEAITAYDPREVALLPTFCKYTQDYRSRIPGVTQEDIARWRNHLGPTYEHTHHYCWGLMKSNRAVLLVRDRDLRISYLADAVKEFDYVLDRSTPDFVLLPEILLKKGENLLRLGKGPTAVNMFERALEAKPDYWPAVAQLSDYYKSAGDLGKAREVLEAGLSSSPDASALKRRLGELGAPRHVPKPAS